MVVSKIPDKFHAVFFGKKDYYTQIEFLPATLKHVTMSYVEEIDDLRRLLKQKNPHLLFMDYEDSFIPVSTLSEIVALDYPDIINVAILSKKEDLADIYKSIEEGFIHFFLYKNSLPLEYQIVIKMAIKKFCDLVITQELVYKVKTNSQKLEAEVKKKTAALEEIILEKKNYFNFIVHELKGPLTAVKGSLDVLKEFENMGPAQKEEFLSLISFHFNEILRMVNSILDFSKSQDYRMELNPKYFSLNLLMEKIRRVFQIIARQKKIELVIDTPSYELEIRGDEEKLEMAFSNLIYNAIKYTDTGGVRVSFEKKTEGSLEHVLVCVKDTGRGIDVQEISQIFELYQRGKSSENVPGTGIGLYFTKNIIETHGGKIWCESEGEGKGSIFYVRIPFSIKDLKSS